MNVRDFLLFFDGGAKKKDMGDSPDTYAGLVSWFKADAITGKDDGDEITAWTDSAGNNNAVAPSTDKPVYKTNILNGKPVVRFSASRLDFTNRNPTPSTLIAVLKAADNSQNIFLLSNISSYDYHANFSGAPAVVSIIEAVNNPVSSDFSVNENVWNIAGWRSASGSIAFYESTTARGSGSIQNINLSLGRIGGDVFGAGQGNFDLAELIWYNNQLSVANYGRVIQYLKVKYNL